MDFYEFFIEDEDVGKRLDLFLHYELNKFSRTKIQKLIEDNNVFINNNTINKNYKLKKNDFIKVKVPLQKQLDIKPENIPLDILYEDEDVIIINKPQNMVVHPAAGNYSNTLVNALLYHFKNNLSSINGVLRPGIVHRIDKNTSGIIVVAKNDFSHNYLAEQFAKHSIIRIYNAIVFNNLKNDFGTINMPIGRHPIDRKKMAVVFKNSKNAITHYNVLERFKKFNLIELKLETGRTHQIRVHMAKIGHPLLGDDVYGSKKQPFNLLGQTLHAKVLGFIHPKTQKYMHFETELPIYFQNIIQKL